MIAKLKAPTIYAIEIVKYIGENQQEALVANDISQGVGLTQSYFMNIVKKLRKSGLLNSIQGRYGGFLLNSDLAEISVYDVVKAMEGDEETRMDRGPDLLAEMVTAMNDDLNDRMRKIKLTQL